jgi:aspartate aminotransferase-like enzyme
VPWKGQSPISFLKEIRPWWFGEESLARDGGEICKAYGIEFIPVDVEWGKAVDPKKIEEILKADPSIRAVYTQASETSTGVKHPIKEIAEIVKKFENTVIVVDAITGIGVFNLPMDEWGLDVVISGSQKALMVPPGLAFAALSDKAWKFVERSNLPKYYFDFKKELKSAQKNQNSFTPAISLFVGLRESLNLIKKEGLESVFRRHDKLATATRAAVKALGLELYTPESPSNALTAVKVPEGIQGGKLKNLFFEKFGITVAGGQDQAKSKIIRIAHLGYYGRLDMVMVISALEMLLKMRVIAYHPYISKEVAGKKGVDLVSFDELLQRSDYISVHTPLTEETRNLIDKNAFAKMKDGVILINCARGGIINEKDLYDAIKERKVAGAALDVFEKEPAVGNPLLELEEVISTPHLGASTEEAQENVAIAIAQQIVDYLLLGEARNAVNGRDLGLTS